jgi:6-phosphogluconolactonase
MQFEVMRPRVEIYADQDRLIHAAAERSVERLEAALRDQATASFVLTGGHTPKPLYERLAQAPFREHLNWQRIYFFWGDERCVPPQSPESNYGMAWTAFLSKLPIPPGNILRIAGELGDPEQAARHYEEEIRKVFMDAPLPSFDLLLLGMGEDGHTASLFPGTVWDESKWVVANYVPRLKANRITMTPRLLNAAKAVLFLVSGKAKAEALTQVLQGTSGDRPAGRIQPLSGNLTWMVDEPAAGLLDREQLDFVELA